ncbi:hypothetical protein BS47DRAFT_1378202 [Hydnum rufescens UP504]|uniref:U6 snRNA phosphodiesterase 1 n=1 Tax=Hydnum rufescens UP504 TaxID=1448309 RepID=A0A9P6DPS6_9AGAM|nr:hypothetical protein BS47DRAFT_1378202 [Hydnum rufescens UP504]
MKRSLIVQDYGSSSEDSEDGNAQTKRSNIGAPAKKQKVLPSLSPELTSPMPSSDPAAHQGRIRAHPHVEGQWATHIYLPVHFPMDALIRDAREVVPELHSLIEGGDNGTDSTSNNTTPTASSTTSVNTKLELELHISLSRPVFLRAHQREEMRRAVKRLASTTGAYEASFACFTTFRNDEKTRAFLSIELGAGHAECHALSLGLTDTLGYLRQQGYYAQPRFHTSIAWALLHPPSESPTSPFASVSELPADLVPGLEKRYGTELRRIGRFDVDHISVKIGKDVHSWSLGGGT